MVEVKRQKTTNLSKENLMHFYRWAIHPKLFVFIEIL